MNKIKILVYICLALIIAAGIERYTLKRPVHLSLCLSAKTPQNTFIQLFYDHGKGFSEEHSSRILIKGGESFDPIRFLLPSRPKIKSLRLDPCDTDAIIELADVRISDFSGKTLRKIDPNEIQEISGIQEIEVQNDIALIKPDSSRDPQLKIDIPYPLKFPKRFHPIRFGIIFLTGSILLFIIGCMDWSKMLPRIKDIRNIQIINCIKVHSKYVLFSFFVIIALFFVFKSIHVYHAPSDHLSLESVTLFDKKGDDQKVVFYRSDGLRIEGSLYGADNPSGQRKPGILLLHGNLMVGRKTPIIQVLAEFLERKGYIVLTIDFSGFGTSQDPFVLGKLEAININQDARAALSFFASIEQVDKNSISVIGHSMGAGPAIKVGIERSEVKAIIAMGPPRRVTELYRDAKWSKFFWDLARNYRASLYQAEFPEWYTKKVWANSVIEEDMIRYIPYFQKKNHKPLLLIHEENNDIRDRKYLNNFYDRISYPKEIVLIRGVNHFWNTEFKNGQLYYSPKAMEETIAGIDAWIRSSDSTTKLLCDRFRNALNPIY